MPAMQAFNRGLFDFLIATDDPSKQQADMPASASQHDVTDGVAAVLSQQPEAEGEAAVSPAADGKADDDDAAEHAWTEAAAKLKITKVRLSESHSRTAKWRQNGVYSQCCSKACAA